jgi:predicted lipoprotein with Yx(FWY)xxD motif
LRYLSTIFGALATTFVIAGCGSSSSSSGSSSTTSSSAAATTATTTTPASTAPAGESSSASSEPGVTITAKKDKLGTILAAGPKKLTVYLFEADKGGQSSCSGACAKAWPPVTTTGEPQAGGAAVTADLGTISRSDGTKQVTYKGHPLYFFVKDKEDDDTYGQGSDEFGAEWYVMKPSGNKIDDDDDSDKGDDDGGGDAS